MIDWLDPNLQIIMNSSHSFISNDLSASFLQIINTSVNNFHLVTKRILKMYTIVIKYEFH